jgi:hypothetical protein
MWLFCDEIYKVYIEPKKKYKKNIAKRHLQKILIDTYHAWYFDPTLCLSVSFNNNDYTLHSRYNKLKITKKTIALIKDLVNSELLHHKAGMPAKSKYSAGLSYVSRIWPTEQLIKYFLDLKFNIINISAHDIDKETIVLCKKITFQNNSQKQQSKLAYKNIPIDYSDTPKIRAMRLVLACYNLLLRKTHMDISTSDKYYTTTTNAWGAKTQCFIEPNCFIHRKFINSTFKGGGRIYGGWWQNCYSTHRKNILINGNPVVEVAYNGLQLGILYQTVGKNLYDVVGSGDGNIFNVSIPELDNIPETRLGNYSRNELMQFKKFLLRKLTYNGITSTNEDNLWRATIKAITAEQNIVNGLIRRPPRHILKTISHKFLASVFDRIKQKHQLIAHYFLSGVAPKLQLIESNITMNLIEHFTALKVPILTLHDSYIIEQKWGQTLINAMQCSWIEEMSNLETTQNGMPKRSKHLERLTSHDDHWKTRHLLAQPNKITTRTGTSNFFNRPTNKPRTTDSNMQSLFKEGWSEWHDNIIKIKPMAISTVSTDRYQTSLKVHREWLLEGDTEDDSIEIKNRYNSFYSDINSGLYTQWLRSKPLWMQTNDNK